MIAELGHFALILALLTSMVQALSPAIGQNDRFVALADHGARLALVLTGGAMLALIASFMRSDFSLVVVASNSHSAKPLLYKFGGAWGNHEGSLLLWVCMLTLFAAAISVFGGNLPGALRQRVLAVMGAIATGFLLLLITTSNPFARLDPAPFEGKDLNPLLQDPGLIFHPPMLYAGYVGFSVAFAFALAALWQGKVDEIWAKWVRPWVLMAWICLSIGITMGSWWAYYELGWGGWWYWDPVENASLMPWMTGTALLHSVLVVEKRAALKTWTVFLAIITFSLSLLGTFLVRSGVLTSVHAFATDPARGAAILGLLGITIGVAFVLFAWRGAVLRPKGLFAPLSRETGLILNNLFLVCAAATILVGTLFPIVNDALEAPPVSVGAPFYEATILPLLAPLVFLVGIGPFVPWRRARWVQIWPLLRGPVIGLTLCLVLCLILFRARGILAIIGVLGGVWLVMAAVRDVLAQLEDQQRKYVWSRFLRLSWRFWGRSWGHLGFGIFLLGATGTNVFQQQKILPMMPGAEVLLGDFRFQFVTVSAQKGPNYKAQRAHFSVHEGGRKIADIYPERRLYPSVGTETAEAGISTDLSGDLFITLGPQQENGAWQVRVVRHPLVPWIWAGGMLMALGGGMAIASGMARGCKT